MVRPRCRKGVLGGVFARGGGPFRTISGSWTPVGHVGCGIMHAGYGHFFLYFSYAAERKSAFGGPLVAAAVRFRLFGWGWVGLGLGTKF